MHKYISFALITVILKPLIKLRNNYISWVPLSIDTCRIYFILTIRSTAFTQYFLHILHLILA